jgi:hypothetical protein
LAWLVLAQVETSFQGKRVAGRTRIWSEPSIGRRAALARRQGDIRLEIIRLEDDERRRIGSQFKGIPKAFTSPALGFSCDSGKAQLRWGGSAQ